MTNIDGAWYNYYCDALLQYICETYPVTYSPTRQPVHHPTVSPSSFPTTEPTTSPTRLLPTRIPTAVPTLSPTSSSKHEHTTRSPTSHQSNHPIAQTYGCPGDFKPVHSTCYLFVSTATTYSQANETCKEKNGWLVTIESEVEDQALLLWLQSHSDLKMNAQDNSGPYIGLYRDASSTDFTSKSFHWISHAKSSSSSSSSSSTHTSTTTTTTTTSQYSQWALNYPLFDRSTNGEDETNLPNCVVISIESGWMNVQCTSSHQYVCETNMVTMETVPLDNNEDNNDDEAEFHNLLIWSLLIPGTLIAGGFLFYSCSKFKSNRRTDRQFLPTDEPEYVSSTHSLVHSQSDHHNNNNNNNNVKFSQPDPHNGKYNSKYNYKGDTSPEETMEIQLQMRSYAPLTQNSI